MPPQITYSSQEREIILDFLVQISPERRLVLMEILDSHDQVESPTEKRTILKVLNSCLFRGVEDVLATDVRRIRERSDGYARAKLNEQRFYVGEQIRVARDSKGLSQRQLAEKCGIPQSHLSNLEHGKHVATFKTIQRIAKGLGVAPNQLDPSIPHELISPKDMAAAPRKNNKNAKGLKK